MTRAIFYAGLQIDRSKQESDAEQKALDASRVHHENVDQKRIQLWDKMGPCLDKILSYVTYVGDWQRLKATDIISCKRSDDALFFTYRPFFTNSFGAAYNNFMSAAFRTYNAFGKDATIKANTDGRAAADLTSLASDKANPEAVHDAYDSMLKAAGNDFELDYIVEPYKAHDRSPRKTDQSK